ncbi:hypothetical protein [Nocardiopsis mwathae]|nr:hypothetical protein [Nocardiopsis mwathae]
MPGTLVGVRVMMVILGAGGLLLAVLTGLLADPQTTDGQREAAFLEHGVENATGWSEALFWIAVATGAYAVLALGLAAVMGRRTPVVWWLLAAFHGAMTLWWLWVLVDSPGVSFLPLALSAAMLGLVLMQPSRTYYRNLH